MALCSLAAWALAGCGDSEPVADRSPPVRYAPPAGDPAAENGHSQEGSLPPAHPPVAASAGADRDANVLRTGPSLLAFPAAGITFSVPAGWKELRPSQMDAGVIDARLAVPAAEGTEPQITMSQSGGGIELNVERWKGQFPEATGDDLIEETIPVGNVEAAWIELRGDFHDPFRPRQPEHSDWSVIGAAIPLGGERDFYVKLSGPRAAVAAVRDEFRRFISGARLKPAG
jgi:hypothetical protein